MYEFELKYNEITNRKRNIFYFQYYCNDIEEFKDWLTYNELTTKDFTLLNKDFQSFYIQHIYEIMIKFLSNSLEICARLGIQDKQIKYYIDETQILMNRFSYYTCLFDRKKKRNIINKIKQFLLIYPGYIIIL